MTKDKFRKEFYQKIFLNKRAAMSCPENAFRNETTTRCVCKIGYIGSNCVEKCENGTFGFACHQKCECPIEECHFESGCRITTDKVSTEPVTSTWKWRTAARTISYTSATTQVQPEENVLFLTVVPVIAVTSVLLILLVVCCCYLKKRKRNRVEECPASAQHLIVQERIYTATRDSVYSVVEKSNTPSECLGAKGKQLLQTCSVYVTTSNADNKMSKEEHMYDTQEASEGHYNKLLLRTALYNQNTNSCIDSADMYSHIKASEGTADVLLLNEQYDHVNVVFNT